MNQHYVFLLWREKKLSRAEIYTLFKDIAWEGDFAVVSDTEERILFQARNLGGTIKIGQIIHERIPKSEIADVIIQDIESRPSSKEWKIKIGCDGYISNLSNLPFRIKETLKKRWYSVRIVQHTSEGRVRNATTIHEKLVSKWSEYMIFPTRYGVSIARTLWVQDIEGYTHRDMDRKRSMDVGMMPPKVAQIMLNLWTRGDHSWQVWDPFCGLWTTLIEAVSAWYHTVIATDKEEKMVTATQENLENLFPEKPYHLVSQVLDAKNLVWLWINLPTVIVTEGMLGKNFTSSTVSLSAILQEREYLVHLYTSFLDSAWKSASVEKIVFSLPFWHVSGKKIYMPEISSLTQTWTLDVVHNFFGPSLEYHRVGQIVGRQIYALSRTVS